MRGTDEFPLKLRPNLLSTPPMNNSLRGKIEVLRLIAAGNANKLVASELSITEETVKGHVKNILSKLGANDRTHAVTIAIKRGIIEI